MICVLAAYLALTVFGIVVMILGNDICYKICHRAVKQIRIHTNWCLISSV